MEIPRGKKMGSQQGYCLLYIMKSRMDDQEAEESSEKSLSLAKFLDMSYFFDLWTEKKSGPSKEGPYNTTASALRKHYLCLFTKGSIEIHSCKKVEYPVLSGIIGCRY